MIRYPHLAARVFELVLSGDQSDRERAVGLARTLDMESLDDLRGAAQAVSLVVGEAKFAKLQVERAGRWKRRRTRRKDNAA